MYDFEFAEPSMTTFNLIRQTWAALNKATEIRLAKIGLTPEKTAVLWACRDYPGALSPAEISRMLFRENQTIAGLLNRMEREGLVKRIPKRKGHPFTEVRLTEKGEELCGPAVEIMRQMIASILGGMPAERQGQLQELLGDLRGRALDTFHLEPGKPFGGAQKPIDVKW
jgi:MarR family transcriptional regulator for hemolysin